MGFKNCFYNFHLIKKIHSKSWQINKCRIDLLLVFPLDLRLIVVIISIALYELINERLWIPLSGFSKKLNNKSSAVV